MNAAGPPALRPPLHRLLDPRRVALVGSVSRETGLGARTLRHLRGSGFTGDVVCAASADEVDGAVDVAVVAVPAAAVPGAVERLAGRAGHIVVYSSGFEEAGGRALARPAAGGARIIGPNSVGLLYTPTGNALTFAAAVDGLGAERGGSGIFLISQSGAFGARLVQSARHYGVGVDGFVGSGNETDYSACELGADLVADPVYRPKVLALYLEGVRDAAALAALLRAAADADVSVALLLGGESASGARAARSHTAAVSPDHAVAAELCGAFGAVLAGSDRELVEASIALAVAGRAAGGRVGVVTGSGGAGVVAADLLARGGCVLPQPGRELRAELAEALPPYASPGNPVDVTAQVIGDTPTVAGVCSRLAGSGEVDAVLLVGRAEQAPALQNLPVPAVVAALGAAPPSVADSLRRGLPVFPGLHAACDAVRAVCAPRPPRGPALDSPPEGGTAAGAGRGPDTPAGAGRGPDTAQSLRIIEAAGIDTAPWRSARTPAEALAAASELMAAPDSSGLVVLKANLPAEAHKAQRGAVRLDVGPDGVEHAAAELLEMAPSVIVARQLRGGPELIVGVRTDPVFGRIVVAGLGGGHVELLSRTVSVPAAVPRAWLERRLTEAVFARGGGRHRGLASRLTRTAAALTRFAAHHHLALAECNPLIPVDGRLIALDARVITRV